MYGEGRSTERLTPSMVRVDVFVHGEAGEVRAVRKHLLSERGIDRKKASISPYWRRTMTDEEWRTIKSAWLTDQANDV